MKPVTTYPAIKAFLFILLCYAFPSPVIAQTLSAGVISPDTLWVPLDSVNPAFGPSTRKFTVFATTASGGNGAYAYRWLCSPSSAAPVVIFTSGTSQNFDTTLHVPSTGIRLRRR